MGTKSHFLPVLPLSGDDIIAPAVLPMSSNGSTAGPGGLRPPLPQPRAQGKPDPVPHPGFWGIPPPQLIPIPFRAWVFNTRMAAAPAPCSTRSKSLYISWFYTSQNWSDSEMERKNNPIQRLLHSNHNTWEELQHRAESQTVNHQSCF